MQYVFHLGVHRTASALLQENLSRNIDQLRTQRVYYINHEKPRAATRFMRMIRRRHKPGTTPHDIADFTDLNAALLTEAETAGATCILISGDDLLGPSINQSLSWEVQNPGFYPQASTNLSQVLSGVPLDKTRLLLYTRNPESYLLSLYSDAIRNAQTGLTLERYCSAINFNSIDFARLEKDLVALHPQLEVKTRQHERIKLGAETYIRTFLRDIGLDPKPFRLHTPPARPQLDAIQVEALLHIMAGSQSKRWKMIKRLRDQVLGGAPNPQAPLVLPEWVTDSMRVTADGRASDHASSAA